MGWRVAAAHSRRAGGIKVQASSGSAARRQQPAAGLPCTIFIMAISKKCFKKAEGKQPSCLTESL